MPDTLIIYERKNACICAGFNSNKLSLFRVDEKNNIYKTGNIFVGHVTKIILHLKAAYVDIGMSKNCYMEMQDGFDYITADSHPDGELHVGDEIVVQIKKEAGRGKPATVGSDLEIAGKYFVLKYNGIKKRLSFSSKIKDPPFKKEKTKHFDPLLPEKYELIFRTNSHDADDKSLMAEYEALGKTLSELIAYGSQRTKGSLLYESLPDYLVWLRDKRDPECKKILTDDPDIFIRLRDFLGDDPCLSFYSDKVLPLDNLYDMRKNIRELMSERVWLRSGASIIIQQTEALTVVDVNSSKASSEKKNFREGFLSINIEAAEEISRQLRLRNISGIIIIDFINDKKMNRQDFLSRLSSIFSDDTATQVVDFTSLGLVELTRRRESIPVKEFVLRHELDKI